jgi:hypothetical protein
MDVLFYAGLLLWLIALAFPFFGVINDVLGAFTSTFEVRWRVICEVKKNQCSASALCAGKDHIVVFVLHTQTHYHRKGLATQVSLDD